MPIDTVYDDKDHETINKLSPDAPHREVDLAWLEASRELAGKAKIAIFIPATVYGVGTGWVLPRFLSSNSDAHTAPRFHRPFRKISIQIPMKVEAALKVCIRPDFRGETVTNGATLS